MHQFPNHDGDFAHEMCTSPGGDTFDMPESPDPRYYRNAPRYDEGHVNTSSYECSTASSASHHTPDHSPKSTGTAATTVVHANDASAGYSNQDAWEEERDAPEEDIDYRDDGYESHPVPEYGNDSHLVPEYGNEHPSTISAPNNSFVSAPHDAPPHGYPHHMNHYPNGHHQLYHQPLYSYSGYDAHYHHHHYGHHPPAHAPPHHYHHLPNDPSYYTNAFDAPIPDHFQQPAPPNGEVIDVDEAPTNAAAGASHVQVVREYNDRDILCGRGALMIWHPGNKHFRRLVQTHRQRYFFSRRQEKKKIASQIIEEVRIHGGRFLRKSQSSDNLNEINVWVEIDEERAYQKVCQALREGAPEIRKQWRNKPTSRGASSSKREETKENADNAASKRNF